MKTAARIEKVFKQQIRHLLAVLKKKKYALSDKDFHSIRVDIKKIHALFELVEKSDPSFHQKKNFAPFKLVFEQAGQIRDKEVIQTILHEQPYNASIEKFEFDLFHQINKEKKQFFKLIKSSLLKNISHHRSKVSDFINHIHHKAATKYVKKKTNALHDVLIEDHVDPSNLHEIRKQIKDVYYIRKMIEPKNNQASRTDQLQELLGQWHDGRVLLQELDKYLESSHLTAKDQKPYESLKKRIRKENEAQFNAILNQKSTLINLFA